MKIASGVAVQVAAVQVGAPVVAYVTPGALLGRSGRWRFVEIMMSRQTPSGETGQVRSTATLPRDHLLGMKNGREKWLNYGNFYTHKMIFLVGWRHAGRSRVLATARPR
jgi:hypothetical protein